MSAPQKIGVGKRWESHAHTALKLAVTAALLALFVATPVGIVGAQPAEITNAEELRNVSEDLEADYVLVDDIDMSGVEGFEPVGECGFDLEEEGCASQPFDGSFDGNGNTVSNLNVERENESDVGLFGAIGEEGTVKNLRLEGVSVVGQGTVGGLAGTNLGEVTDVRAEGTVEGDVGVGMLVGLNRGFVNDSRATGTVEADGSAVGGLIGSNDGGSTGQAGLILRSRSEADVEVGGVDDTAEGASDGGTEADTNWAGGLVGVNFGGEVRDSSARGAVLSSASEVGGLAGANVAGDITDSRAKGDVRSDASEVGGLVGSNDGAVTDSRAEGDVDGGVTVGGLVGRSSVGEIDGSVASGTVSGDEEVGGIVGVLGDERLEVGTAVFLRNSRWEGDSDLPTVAVVEEGEGEVVLENVTPPVERTARRGADADDAETETDTDAADMEDEDNETTEEDSAEEASGEEEGLPGFTSLTAILALALSLVAAALFVRKIKE